MARFSIAILSLCGGSWSIVAGILLYPVRFFVTFFILLLCSVARDRFFYRILKSPSFSHRLALPEEETVK